MSDKVFKHLMGNCPDRPTLWRVKMFVDVFRIEFLVFRVQAVRVHCREGSDLGV